jgi:hypothetical protein
LAENVREQGILDAALVGISRVVRQGGLQAIGELARRSGISMGAIEIGDSMPADLGPEPTATLDALFKALVARPTARRPGIRKAELLDRVVDGFRKWGAPIRRGEYLDDFLMEAGAAPHHPPATPILVESFALADRDWSRVERGAGHFCFAVEQLEIDGLVVFQEPNELSDDEARRSFDRISRWISSTGMSQARPSDLAQLGRKYGSDEQLPLVMA